MDKAMGKAKEAYGALTGDEAKKAEGRAEQRRAAAEAEAEQRKKTRQAEPKPSRRRKSETGKGSRTRVPWAASPTRRSTWEASRTS